MQPGVLILAPDTDPHACAVAWALEQQGITPILTPSLQAKPGVHYAFGIDAEQAFLLDSTVGAQGVSAIWNRRLQDPEPTCAEADRAFASLEWKLFQRNVFSLAGAYGDALWVNRLPESIRAEHKLVQLSACRRLGLPFPDTVVTTDAEQVDALRRKWGRIIFKSFMMHQWQDHESGEQHSVGVALLDQNSELPAEAIAICPGIYQRYIDKSFDVRVTVMGEQLFALSLRKRATGGYVDWRIHTGSADMQAEAITLPAMVESRLRALMRELGLVFGCIDLAVDREGNYYFLEVNQAGQFLFVEEMMPAFPILQSMAGLLMSGRTDGTGRAPKPVTMKQFRASEACAALKERVGKLTQQDEPLFSLE
jgi:glutathione synthase/RimK-type ligase-like ATP-grasp enzyme